MTRWTFRWEPRSEAKRFESASLRAIDGRACERRVPGIEFWDYCPTTNSEIHGL
ncbi:hypothetical protein BDN67DRAFT_976093 [Paxillus ammoniavirescens]|nr:hypothetical protein BDN67DRAFT_976093 [Paxillus ammoniavirescens]